MVKSAPEKCGLILCNTTKSKEYVLLFFFVLFLTKDALDTSLPVLEYTAFFSLAIRKGPTSQFLSSFYWDFNQLRTQIRTTFSYFLLGAQ